MNTLMLARVAPVLCALMVSIEALAQGNTVQAKSGNEEIRLHTFVEGLSSSSALPLIVSRQQPVEDRGPLPHSLLLAERLDPVGRNYNLNDVTREMSAAIGLNLTKGVLVPKLNSDSEKPEELSENEVGLLHQVTPDPQIESEILVSDDESSSGRDAIMSLGQYIGAGSNCLEDFVISVGAWADERPFGQQISELRRQLYREFDEIDPDVQLSLMRAYVYFGFGAEAIQVGHLQPADTAEFVAVNLVSRLLEYGVNKKSSELVRYSDCGGAFSFWSILASGENDLFNVASVKSALQELYKLPRHLQIYLAPKLAEQLREAGYFEEANTSLRVLYRVTGDVNEAAQLQQAELLAAIGDKQAAGEILLDISETNSLEAAKALVRYIDLVADDRGRLSETIVEFAEVYSRELRNSEIGPEITRAHVLALAKSGDFSTSYAIMQNAKLLEIDAVDYTGKFFDILSREAGDFDFVRRALAITSKELSALPSTTKFRIANRLHSLGFDVNAEGLLAAIPPSIFPRRQRVLRAKVALALGNFDRVISLLTEEESEEAKLIMAKAYAKTGAAEQAFQIYSNLGLSELAELSIWRSNLPFPSDFEGSEAANRVTDLSNGSDEVALAGQLAQLQQLVKASGRLTSDVAFILDLPDLR